MAKRVNIVGKKSKRINVTGRILPAVPAAQMAAELGGSLITACPANEIDPISLAEVGTELVKRLRSTGGRPSLADATQQCKVPLSGDDVAALERIVEAIARATGSRPALGQI